MLTCALKAQVNEEGEKNTRREGCIVFSFSSFSPIEVTNQKQIEFNFWCDN